MRQFEILTEGLTEDQEAALQAILASRTMEEAAAALNIARSSLYRLLEQPELAAALRRARSQRVELAVLRLQEQAAEAVNTLGEVLRDTRASAASRVRAAEVILEFTFRGSELLDITAQMEEIRRLYETVSAA